MIKIELGLGHRVTIVRGLVCAHNLHLFPDKLNWPSLGHREGTLPAKAGEFHNQ